MDDKAHTILSEVIAGHGEQLTISTAFCKVYLTGYLADYPDEKSLLIALKELELPATLLAFVKTDITERTLFQRINEATEGWTGNPDHLAWGVDAWASAVGVSDAMRCKIRQACFAITPVEQSVTPSIPAPIMARRSRLGSGAKLMTSVAGVLGLMMLQVFGGNSQSYPLVMSMILPAESVAPVASVLSDVAPPDVSRVMLVDIPLLHSTLKVAKPTPHKLVQIDKPKPIQKKNHRLLAETESFLRYGN